MFNADDWTLQTLTAGVNKTPFVETTLSRFFRTGRLRTTTAMIERGSTGLELIDPVARGTVPAATSNAGLSRAQFTISSVKLADVVNITADKVQDLRAFGEEDIAETYQTVLDQETGTVRRWIENTHENLRFGTVKGVQYAKDGVTEIFNFYTAAGVAAPADVDINFSTASRAELMDFYADHEDHVRTGLGADADAAQAVMYIYGKRAWRRFRTSDPVAELYERYQDGSVNREGALGQRRPFELFDAMHMPYYGASIGEDEWRAVPVGVPNLFKTDFTPLDNPETANTLGVPLYATPERAEFGKGYKVELASLPIHYVTRPECLIGGSNIEPV
ncbi:major capsid protein E [Roseovarius halotolerans]|uniref:Phage major capsid protein E n=1 Tax=Roseovarius halotolerans TaxID=505353 RepID=A0A1X6Y5Q4_9RHOB|nr:major capsid protein [Roseovarius halotolerans]RKT35295.1 major capsid protein E [Roseovarius halotolerans]SLN11179.1 hypothetical protein ROH8110_00068 [Roseovarius halotolerans]